MADGWHMQRAIELALAAEQEGNLPVGAVITRDGTVVAEGRNRIWVPGFDATRHAEMEALRAVPDAMWPTADRLTLYTTLEPCLMCFAAILLHGIGRVVFGASDGYGGAGPALAGLPPYFQAKKALVQWSGPIMPEACDPLYARLMLLVSGQ